MSMARPVTVSPDGQVRPGRRGRASSEPSTYAARSPASAIRPADQAATCRSSAARNASSRSVRSTSCPAIASDVAVGTGSSSAVGGDVDPDPEHGRRPRRGVHPLDQDAGDLEVTEQDVVGPLEGGVRLGRQGVSDGEPGEQRQPRPAVGLGLRAQQDGHGQRRAGRGLPDAVERPRPAVWCSATTTRPAGASSCRARSATTALVLGGAVEDLDGVRAGGRRRQAVAVERWARRRGIGHGHYIGRRTTQEAKA